MLLTTRTASAAGGGSEQAMRLAAASGDASVMAALSQQGGSASSGSLPVRLRDVADVRQGYKEREAIIRLNGREAVELAIYKEGDANTVVYGRCAGRQKNRDKSASNCPHDIELTVTIEDQSVSSSVNAITATSSWTR
jgi:HAE1 family hydrophobic/amphiphilic exporter-1